MNDPMPRDYTYAMALATLITKDIGNEKIWGAQVDAVRRVYGICEGYAKDGFDKRVIDTIMEKKARMILEATTIKDLNEISSPPKPKYDGREWHLSGNEVPEEEMIWWSKTSLRGPLVHAAAERYYQLIKDFYGEDSLHIPDLEDEKSE